MDAEKNTSRVKRLSERAMARISSPVRSGIEMSRTAMSGAKLRIVSIQFGPSPQHATTSKSLCAASTLAKPCRTMGWRSAITTLVQRMGDSQPVPQLEPHKPRAPTDTLCSNLARVTIFFEDITPQGSAPQVAALVVTHGRLAL